LHERDLVWIRGHLFDPSTNDLEERIINVASEFDHLSHVILPTVREFEHYQDTFARCLDYAGTTNYKSFQNDLKPESSMIKSKPYDLGIAMNGISGRKLERYVRAAKLIPGDPACSLPVFLVCVPNEKGSSQVEELRRYFQLQCHT